MSARIKIEVQVPAGSDLAVAHALAKIRAAEALNIHIVEETLLPVLDQREVIDNDGIGVNTVPNNSSVDRILTTWWEFHS